VNATALLEEAIESSLTAEAHVVVTATTPAPAVLQAERKNTFHRHLVVMALLFVDDKTLLTWGISIRKSTIIARRSFVSA